MVVLATLIYSEASAVKKPDIIDLTQPLFTFHPQTGPTAEDATYHGPQGNGLFGVVQGYFPKVNFGAPIKDFCRPLTHVSPAFDDLFQTVGNPTLDITSTLSGVRVLNQGNFSTPEHIGTHLDSPYHVDRYPNAVDQRTADEIPVGNLVGPIVFIDISDRVQSELNKNSGIPTSQNITDFSNNSAVALNASDIDAIAPKLKKNAWVVLRTGWEQFYSNPANISIFTSLYGNCGFVVQCNFPSWTPAAVDRLISILDRKKIRINGLATDSPSADSGDSLISNNPNLNLYVHLRGLDEQGWTFIEQMGNLNGLADAGAENYILVAGTPKVVGGTGTITRVIAIRKNIKFEDNK